MQENWDGTEHTSKPERNTLEGYSEERTIVPQFCTSWDKISWKQTTERESEEPWEPRMCGRVCPWYQVLATRDGVSGWFVKRLKSKNLQEVKK